ncbi:EcsC family protein [Neobacillus mesonae]|uniref:EcsC family protein n=1 Tax=Neobacillus mesonae TaxID=1193713 RepID=UPI00203CF14D|nr:EcsC family protein [Neobacillus mesonae]MCM3569605.1 EcsC family protein [Neobacillus mesonae]
MPLTDRERYVLNDIQEWEKKLNSYEPNDFQQVYEKYLERSFSLLPERVQRQFFSVIDTWLFHLHGIIQGSQLQMDAKERIIASGRIFQKEIEEISDMQKLSIDQLQYIAEQQIARHRLYSLAQGGLAGKGGALLLGTDIPAMAVINLRVVQLIAMTYGYEINSPHEMMTSLKVFHTGTLPARMQLNGWSLLMEEMAVDDGHYFYQGMEEITDITWIEQPLQQLLKAIVITLFRKKMFQGIPLVSMTIGAGANYQLTRKVTDLAHKYYQYRYLKAKEEL